MKVSESVYFHIHGKKHTCYMYMTLYICVYSRFLDPKANDRVLLFLVDKRLQNTKGLRDGALEKLKEDSDMHD